MAQIPVVSEAQCLRSFPEFYKRTVTNKTYCAGARNGTDIWQANTMYNADIHKCLRVSINSWESA